MDRAIVINDEKISTELLKEFYDKHKDTIDKLAAADNDMFKAVKTLHGRN